MTVDPKHHKHFVARRGEVLRQIGEEFGGVIVSFPRSGVDSDKVRFFCIYRKRWRHLLIIARSVHMASLIANGMPEKLLR